jgi:hypothetical protein
MRFYLGAHQPIWLTYVNFPLFISRRRLLRYKKFKPATCSWALDSGGFSELNLFGKWTCDERTYINDIRKYSEQIGGLEWAAAQDWMCEPFVLNKTGKTVEEHQRLTIDNFLTLKELNSPVRIVPVIQGFAMDEYVKHIEMYAARGVDLFKEPLVGIGSVCRRQGQSEVIELIKSLSEAGLKLHGFGFKIKGLIPLKDHLASSDSMAWSFDARYGEKLPECTDHVKCANCLKYAIKWRNRLMQMLY